MFIYYLSMFPFGILILFFKYINKKIKKRNIKKLTDYTDKYKKFSDSLKIQ